MKRRLIIGTPLSLWGILFVVAGLCFVVLQVWALGSGLTSGVKALTDSCGKTYPVEAVFSGDWFCPE